MADYKPKGYESTRLAVQLLKPTKSSYHGVSKSTYPSTGDVIFVNWKSYGGTETVVDGVLSVIDTAQISCRYRPDITPECALKSFDGTLWHIVGTPENIDMANRVLSFKVQAVKGGA